MIIFIRRKYFPCYYYHIFYGIFRSSKTSPHLFRKGDRSFRQMMTNSLLFDEINRLISTAELQTICKNIEKTFFATSFVPFFAVFSADMQL
mgnify:CR=1 FL=1